MNCKTNGNLFKIRTPVKKWLRRFKLSFRAYVYVWMCFMKKLTILLCSFHLYLHVTPYQTFVSAYFLHFKVSLFKFLLWKILLDHISILPTFLCMFLLQSQFFCIFLQISSKKSTFRNHFMFPQISSKKVQKVLPIDAFESLTTGSG